jgi:hypothetical protein
MNNKRFTKITPEEQEAAVNKFVRHERGALIGGAARVNYQPRDTVKGANELTFGELKNPELCKPFQLKRAMAYAHSRCINANLDPILEGKGLVAFTHVEMAQDVKIAEHEFTWFDVYLLLRAALEYQKSTADYATKMKRKEVLLAQIEAGKTKKERMADAKAELEAIMKDLG